MIMDFYQAMADGGWLGIAIPEAYDGSGLGVNEACEASQPRPGAWGRCRRSPVSETFVRQRP